MDGAGNLENATVRITITFNSMSSSPTVKKKKRRVDSNVPKDDEANENCTTGRAADDELSPDDAAVQQETSLLFLPEQIKSQLASAKKLILEMINSKHVTARIWNDLSFEWKSDPDLALAALKTGVVSGSALPETIQNDRNLLLQAVRHRPQVWLDLPSHFADDLAFAKAISLFRYDVAAAVFERFPSLRSDPEIWMKIIHNWSHVDGDRLPSLLRLKSESTIRGNKDVMLQAFRVSSNTLSVVEESLFQDEDFVKSILERYRYWITVFHHFPHKYQIMWLDLIVQAFRSRGRCATTSETKRLVSNMAPLLLENREVVVAWFSGGGPLIKGCFPAHWGDDEEILLLIARNSPANLARCSFKIATRRLKTDKTFMLKVIQFQSLLYFKASSKLRKDFDLIVTALASSGSYIDYSSMAHQFFSAQEGDYALVGKIRNRLQEQLEIYSTFTKVLLPAISLGSESCPLTLLHEESVFKKIIAEYLDFPWGRKFALAHGALENIPNEEQFIEQFAEEIESSSDDGDY